MRLHRPAPPLTLATLALAVTVLAALGVLPRWPGLPFLVALPPLDLFADLRVLVAVAPSYPVFVAGIVLSLAVRIGVPTLLLGGVRHAPLAARFYAVAFLPALVAALLQFSGQAGLYARLFWPGTILMGLTLGLLAPLPWRGAVRIRTAGAQVALQGFRLETLVPYSAALLGLGMIADAGGIVAAVATIPASGLLTFLSVRRLAARAPRRPVVTLAAFAAAGIATFTVVEGTRWEGPQPAPVQPDGSLVLMSGINSASGEGTIFEIDPRAYGYPCERTFHYSYAGPGPGAPQGDSACPIVAGAPYVEEDTQRPLAELVEELRRQLAERDVPIGLLAHSQAPWIAWQALAEHGDMGVARLVLLGAFPNSAVGYPPPGESGPGRIGGDGLRLVAAVGQELGFEFEADAPLAREILATPDASSAIFAQPLPDGVEVLQIPAVADLPLKPDGPDLPQGETACPVRAAHPYLPASPESHRALHRFVAGEPQPSCPSWRIRVGQAGRALAVPPGYAR